MKAKVSRGGGFRGALNYVLTLAKEATHTKTRNVSAATWPE